MIVSFTGHRTEKIIGKEDFIFSEIEKQLLQLKPDKIISGMAIGVDQIACMVAIKNNIPFTAAVPFEGQDKFWPKETKEFYKNLLSEAKETVIVCEGKYAAWKYQKRNIWMVDNSDLLIAYWDGTIGGTKNCIDYAIKVKKPYINIYKHD